MTSGRRSHMPKPFEPFGAGPPYARPAPPTRSFYAACLPSKWALPQLTTDRDFLRPSLPVTCQPPPSPSSTLLLARKPLLTPPPPATPSPGLPLPPSLPNCHTVTYPTHVPLREVAGPEAPPESMCHFHSDMSQIEEKLGSFSENPTRYRKIIPEAHPGL